ncbi:MAG: 50S ribosomal protein L21 [Proteobacteria bacterium]|nr:50S ribosomal protein L21 [Pseudomonadota bacterium]
MYAVFRTGGKQYRAAKGDVLRLEKIEGEEGASVKFDEVLLIGEGSNIKVGNPVLAGSSVSAKVLRQGKSKKVPVVKFKRRQNYLRQGTHRQFFTEVEITGITGAAAKPPAGDKKKPAAAPTAAAKKVTKKAAPKKAPAGDKKAVPKKPPSGDKKAATKKKAAKK